MNKKEVTREIVSALEDLREEFAEKYKNEFNEDMIFHLFYGATCCFIGLTCYSNENLNDAYKALKETYKMIEKLIESADSARLEEVQKLYEEKNAKDTNSRPGFFRKYFKNGE